jgi:hypothetical protein
MTDLIGTIYSDDDQANAENGNADAFQDEDNQDL